MIIVLAVALDRARAHVGRALRRRLRSRRRSDDERASRDRLARALLGSVGAALSVARGRCRRCDAPSCRRLRAAHLGRHRRAWCSSRPTAAPRAGGRRGDLVDALADAEPRIAGIVAFVDLLDERGRDAALDAIESYAARRRRAPQHPGATVAGSHCSPPSCDGVQRVGASELAVRSVHHGGPARRGRSSSCSGAPTRSFVLDHCGKPAIRDDAYEPWAADLERLAAHDRTSRARSRVCSRRRAPTSARRMRCARWIDARARLLRRCASALWVRLAGAHARRWHRSLAVDRRRRHRVVDGGGPACALRRQRHARLRALRCRSMADAQRADAPLAGRTAIVTGGGSGIGQAIAMLFARARRARRRSSISRRRRDGAHDRRGRRHGGARRSATSRSRTTSSRAFAEIARAVRTGRHPREQRRRRPRRHRRADDGGRPRPHLLRST